MHKHRVLCAFALLLAGPLPVSSGTLPPGFIEQDIGGTWDEAVALHFGPGNRMYVVERKGKVWIVENGVKQPQPFIDISDEVGGWRDYGLLGFALHPNFTANGYVYLLYVVDTHHLRTGGDPGNGYNPATDLYFDATIGRITRYTADPTNDRKTVLPGSRFVLLGETPSTGFPILHQSHGTGALVFGMDGTLLGISGDGACYNHTDQGGDGDTYFQHGLDYGIIGADQNIGALRSQYLGSLSGKLVRLDPETGDGLPSNPFWDPANPRSVRSRTWALGLRNPYRFSLKPASGSHNPQDANPGTFFLGDVGWGNSEDFHVIDRPGLNLGWPIFEGMVTRYPGNIANLAARNPLHGVAGCTQQFFNFLDLVKQESNNPVSFPNPCNASVPIPDTWTDGSGQAWRYFKFEHTRPPIAWRGSALVATFDAAGQASTCQVGASGCPVQGAQFSGNASTGGVFYTGDDFPAEYKNTYFHAEFGGQWIRNFKQNAAGEWNRVDGFLTGEQVVFVTTHPTDGGLYYVRWGNRVRRIVYAPGGNLPPTAMATPEVSFGPAPLTVEFNGSASSDPEAQPLQYLWTFGDGGPDSNQAVPPARTFTAPDANPRRFDVKLRVTDSGGATSEKEALVSVNNAPPVVEITSPLPGTLYSMTQDEVHTLSADITDLEHAAGELDCAWQFTLHHNEHTHPEPVNANCQALAPTSPVGCDGNTYFFRATLTVTDAHGLATTRAVDLLPNCTNAQADLGVVVSDAPDPVTVGSSITYTITVANTGTNNVEGVTVTDTLPPGTTLLAAPGNCSLAAGKAICALGAFGMGQSESLSLVVRTGAPGTLVNTVEVTSLTAESNAANNAASTSTQVTNGQAPTASPQSVSLTEDEPVALTLTGSDPEGGALTFQIASAPLHGSLAGAGENRTYTPVANYNGADGFTFTVRDPSGNTSAPAAVSLSVLPANDAPVAVAQAVSATEDTALLITLGANDADGDTLAFALASLPTHGVVSGTAPDLTYSPATGYSGPDIFTFTATDGALSSAPATVTITVAAANDPPTAGTVSISTPEDQARTITLVGSDPDGDPLTFTIVAAPTRGTLSGTGANRTYGPNPNANGGDSFTYRVSDGQATANGSVSITIAPVNDAPVAAPQVLTLDEDASLPISLAGSDVDGDALTYGLVSGPAHGALTGTPPNLTYTPNPNFFGADSFVFQVSDGQVAAPATVSLSVTDVPEPGAWTGGDVGGPGLAGSLALNGGVFSVNGGGADIWDLSDQFHFVRQPLAGDATIVARVVSLTNTNPWAKAGVMIRESLAGGSRHVMVVNTPGNGTALQRRPETGQTSVHTAGVNPGFPYWVRLTRSGNVFTGFTSPDGSQWTSLGSVTVNMATAYVGLAVTAHDNAQLATAVIDNVTLTLGAANTAPTVSDIPNQTMAVNGVLGPLAFTVGDVETPASTLSLSSGSSDAVLVPPGGIVFGGNGVNRAVTITPAAGRSGTATITVSVSDGALSATDTFVLTVTGALPLPWASQDIGSPGLAGSASATGPVFTVKGGGNDIWGTSDKFHFAWQTMSGDGEIRARVSGVQNTNAWAKAGVMMRRSLAANSQHAMMVVTPGNGASFQRRTSTGGKSQRTAGPPVAAPYWVRMTRVGNVFQGYTSADGVNWTSVGSVTMSLPSQVYFGLCVTARDNTKLNTSSFDNVTAIP